MHRRTLSTGWLLAATALFLTTRAHAQEVIVSPLHWYYPEDEGGQLPAPKRPLRGEYPERLKGTGEIFYVLLNEKFSQTGKHLFESITESGSNGLVREAALKAFAEMKSSPARRDNRDADSHVWRAVIFNPTAMDVKTPTAAARLLEVVPAFVPGAKKRGVPWPHPRVKIRINSEGAATLVSFVSAQEPDETVAAAARTAVANWKFAPARKDGQAVESEVEITVLFLPIEELADRADWPPEAMFQASPVYPYAMRVAGLRGQVTVGFTVNPDGFVKDARVLASDNPNFDPPALDAILKWRFKPARHRNQPVAARLTVPIVFNLNDTYGGGDDAYSVSEANRAKLPPEFQYDQPPKLRNVSFAVYPRELLERSVEGTTEIKFIVDRSGHVADRMIVSSTKPEFAQAVVAMLDASLFDPARKSGKPTMTALSMVQRFKTYGDGDVPVSDETKELLSLLKKGKPIATLKELDAIPRARSQREPVFPPTLMSKLDHGDAVVEFFIGEDGTVLLPRTVSATAEEFGYAAVQAVSQWKFDPPLRAGKTVVVRAQIPISFKLR